jgi:hypothetical protein
MNVAFLSATWTLHFQGIIATSVYVFMRTVLDHGRQLRLRQKETQYIMIMLRERVFIQTR